MYIYIYLYATDYSFQYVIGIICIRNKFNLFRIKSKIYTRFLRKSIMSKRKSMMRTTIVSKSIFLQKFVPF